MRKIRKDKLYIKQRKLTKDIPMTAKNKNLINNVINYYIPI